MNAQQMKALGRVWGAQCGLLSESELEALMALIDAEPGVPTQLRVLEVGHYFGLSTCAIVTALQGRRWPLTWSLLSLDAHIADGWVHNPAAIRDFEGNRAKYFADDRLSVSYERSQTITEFPYDVVFYDGDHADEQMRFTQALIESTEPRLFIFDDRDFAVPEQCCEALRRAGWRDESPPLCRLGGDKFEAGTMTLGVFRR